MLPHPVFIYILIYLGFLSDMFV
jgi:hypothetical protein